MLISLLILTVLLLALGLNQTLEDHLPGLSAVCLFVGTLTAVVSIAAIAT